MRLISNSEVNSWLTCRRKYWWEYWHDLEPIEMNAPMANGTIYHAMLEGYYAGKAMGMSEDECRSASSEALIAAAATRDDMAALGAMQSLVTGYYDHYMEEDERYKVVAVETKMKADITDEFSMVGTLDLVWQDLTDGLYVMVDHKSSYNFWTQEQADISAQFQKYGYILSQSGMKVKGLVVNQLRTRTLKEGNDLYRRTWVNMSDVAVHNAVAQHVQAGAEIMEWREDPIKEKLLPVMDKHTCKGCNFLDLCLTDNSVPGNIKYAVQSGYKKRTGYGYNPTETP